MKAFHCTCGQPLFFHNTTCLGCGATVAFEPGTLRLSPLADAGDGTWTLADASHRPAPRFRFCEHRTLAAACNWLVTQEDPTPVCLSCRLTRTIPSLERPRNVDRLAALEAAKRRVVYGLLHAGLPVDARQGADTAGLAFDFLESLPGAAPVLTGHAGGLVTINVAEADDDYRERNRESLREPYRTLIGHLRHELGHYYWDVLVRDSAWLEDFRALFGDERADYGEALARHYRDGPPPDWPQRCISSYAASHPWEDWAETWAHLLHLQSTLQTVASFGLSTKDTPIRITPFAPEDLHDPRDPSAEEFLGWINAWVVLTTVLNETARSMGQPDVYPFVMSRPVVRKLHFAQRVVSAYATRGVPPAPAGLEVG